MSENNTYRFQRAGARRRIVVCAGTGCVSGGSLKVYEAFVQQLREAGLDVATEFRREGLKDKTLVSHSGCQGFCQMGPLVTILPENIMYARVQVGDVPEIIANTIRDNQVVERLL